MKHSGELHRVCASFVSARRRLLRLARELHLDVAALDAVASIANRGPSVLSLRSSNVYAGRKASFIMAPLLRPVESRFSEGRFGVLYSGDALKTAAVEHGYHLGRFISDQRQPAAFYRRAHVGFHVSSDLVDLRASADALFDPSDYAAAQAEGLRMRTAGSPGLLYPSVRRPGSLCVGLFSAGGVTAVRRLVPVGYAWDGAALMPYVTLE